MTKFIGEHLLARNETGQVRCRIATVFPHADTIVTLPGVHATQRVAYLDLLVQERRQQGGGPFTAEEQEAELLSAVDLIAEDEVVLIRPDPDNMPMAFAADELLQTLMPKQRIKFLFVRNQKIREAIKRRGECWRISPLPRSPAEMKQMIQASRIGIGLGPIYYYNKARGTRWLTCQGLADLEKLDDTELRKYLAEIKTFSATGNRLGSPDVAFFMAEGGFGAADFDPWDFRTCSDEALRDAFGLLCERFRSAVSPEFRQDDLDNLEWRRALLAALIVERDEAVPEETLLGLSPEFFMQIEWLPGGRIEDGELILDSIFEQANDELGRLRDEKARGFIFNFIREYGDLEYVSIGRVMQSLSRRTPASGRRDVYLAEIKQRGSDREIVHIIRMQKWGVREHLDEGKSLLEAIIQSEEYTEYIMDRRLGCRQLGMRLPDWITPKRISERYSGDRGALEEISIWSTYFERDYIHGIATDKMPRSKYDDEGFAHRFAHLLGRAAAPNIIVGRCDLKGRVIFDDGDEVVIEDRFGMPREIIVTDHTGTFNDYRSPLRELAAVYAEPVIRRWNLVPDPQDFAKAYLDAFVERFLAIQGEYRKRQRAFDTLFKHRPRNELGSFAYRWEQVLGRLSRTSVDNLVELIRSKLAAR